MQHLLLCILAMTMITTQVSSKSLARPSSALSLLNSIQVTIEELQAENTTADLNATTTDPVPGRMVACDDLCPKWCEKITANGDNITHCHYVCGNVCNSSNSYNNPYVGDFRYEVVPSDFHFERFDLNGDKFISQVEFMMVEGLSSGEVAQIFQFADINGDGHVDGEEFRSGPFVFTVQMAVELSNMAAVHQSEKQSASA